MTLADEAGGIETRQIAAGHDVAEAVRLALAQADGKRVLTIQTIRPTLEEVFVRLTGLGAEVMLAEKGGKG